MTAYNVYLPPVDAKEPSSETFRLVPDSRSILALIFPPLWLIWHRLWLALLAYIAFASTVGMIAYAQPSPLIGYLSALPGFYLLLEGYELVRGRLERLGWRYAGMVEGEDREEAEMRFIMQSGDLLKPQTAPVVSSQLGNSQSLLHRPAAVGLFPE